MNNVSVRVCVYLNTNTYNCLYQWLTLSLKTPTKLTHHILNLDSTHHLSLQIYTQTHQEHTQSVWLETKIIMGRHGYDEHSIQRHHIFHRKNIPFLPIFCRLSIKDINLNNHHRPKPAAADEPSSPKVSCMGQVKRNNRVTGFPAATATTTAVTTSTHHHKYSKLKKLFSSKTLLPPATTSTTTACIVALSAAGSRSCKSSSREAVCLNNLRRLRLRNEDDDRSCEQQHHRAKLVNVGELDPPLPVVKKEPPPGLGRDEVNLWKRRFNGVTLKTLQLDQQSQIHLPKRNISQPPTVWISYWIQFFFFLSRKCW